MLEGVTGQGRVVDLDVQGEILVQTVMAQKPDDGLGVHIVLMLSGFHRFRLNQERTFEALLATIIASHSQQHGEVLFLAFHVGVQQRHIALSAAPEDVVLTAQRNTRIDGVLDLRGSEGGDMEIGIRACAVHVALVSKNVRR